MRNRRAVILATATPLASIFGSGFLIIVPVLTQAVGSYALVGAAAVCLVAWFVGNAIRHNVAVIEPAAAAGALAATERRLERASDAAVVIAYVISVALYLRILAQFVVGYFDSSSIAAQHHVALGCVVLITVVGVVRGLHGLDVMERVALAAVLVLVAVMVVVFAGLDLGRLSGDGITLPPAPEGGLLNAFLVLGGVVISVQGFETVRYLPHIPRDVRIAASRLSQQVSTVVYLLLVGLATPLMASAVAAGEDDTLLQLVQLVAPALVLVLVLCAAGSQFSAAVADTEAGVGNIAALGLHRLAGWPSYAVVGAVSAALVMTLDTYLIIVVASRAFAAYYALQCVIAARTSSGWRRPAYAALASAMTVIALFARPVG